MYQQMVEFFSGAEFFRSVWFGVISLPFVGVTWCVGGVVAGKAPKKNFKMDDLLFCSAVVGLAITLFFILLSAPEKSPDTGSVPFLLTTGAFFVSGMLGFAQNIFLSRAMQCGPNGKIWVLVQSVMVFPFITGIIFFGVKLTLLRLAGIILMLTALIILGNAKDNRVSGAGSWKLYTFITVLIVLMIQLSTSIPFYYKETSNVPPIFCTLGNMSGFVVSGFIPFLLRMNKENLPQLCRSLKSFRFWWYSMGMLPLTALVIFTLQIPGMRAMADNGLGGMSYPVMVGSGIIAFTLYSVFLLKEKLTVADLTANICCAAGLLCICS